MNDSNGSSNDVRIFIGRTGEPLMPVLKSKLTFSDWVEASESIAHSIPNNRVTQPSGMLR